MNDSFPDVDETSAHAKYDQCGVHTETAAAPHEDDDVCSISKRTKVTSCLPRVKNLQTSPLARNYGNAHTQHVTWPQNDSSPVPRPPVYLLQLGVARPTATKEDVRGRCSDVVHSVALPTPSVGARVGGVQQRFLGQNRRCCHRAGHSGFNPSAVDTRQRHYSVTSSTLIRHQMQTSQREDMLD